MPFADYTSFSDCVKKNQDKDNPEAYCADIKRKVEKMSDTDWTYDMTFEKVGDKGGHLYLAGYASNGNEDEDAQNMDMGSLKTVYKTYMENPVVKLLHDKAPQWKGAVGVVVEKFVDSAGKTWETSFGTKPFLVVRISKSPKLEWLRGMIDEGMFRGFSIGGKAKSITDTGTIIVKSWLETSIVDVPSAKGSFFQVLKSACTGDDCPIIKGEMSAEDKKKEREEKLKAEKEEGGEEEKKPNPAVQKLIGAIDNFNGDNMSSNECGINGFCKVADDFLKGGPGSGQKGHKTAKKTTKTKSKSKTIEAKGHRYVISQMTTGAGEKMYTVQRDANPSLKTFKELSDIQYKYPALKGKIGKSAGFIEATDIFLKGGPGSGVKGHKTVHEKQEANRKDMTKFVMMMKKKGLDRDDIRVLLEEMIEKL